MKKYKTIYVDPHLQLVTWGKHVKDIFKIVPTEKGSDEQ